MTTPNTKTNYGVCANAEINACFSVCSPVSGITIPVPQPSPFAFLLTEGGDNITTEAGDRIQVPVAP